LNLILDNQIKLAIMSSVLSIFTFLICIIPCVVGDSTSFNQKRHHHRAPSRSLPRTPLKHKSPHQSLRRENTQNSSQILSPVTASTIQNPSYKWLSKEAAQHIISEFEKLERIRTKDIPLQKDGIHVKPTPIHQNKAINMLS